MGPYFGMDVDSMAGLLFATPSAPFHEAAGSYLSLFGQLLGTNGDVVAANSVIVAWPESIGSLAQLAYSGNVVNSQSSLVDWAVFSGTMSGALGLSGTALDVAQAVMPVLQTAYNTAMAWSSVPLIGGFFVPIAESIRDVSAGMMEAVDTVIQAPTLVQPPAQGWQGPGVSDPGAPVPAPPAAAASSLDATGMSNAADSLGNFAQTGGGLAQELMGMAQQQSLEQGLLPGNGKATKGMPTLGTIPLPPIKPAPGNAGVVVAPGIDPVGTGGPSLAGVMHLQPLPSIAAPSSFATTTPAVPTGGSAGAILAPALGFGGVAGTSTPGGTAEVGLTGTGAGAGDPEGSDAEPELAGGRTQPAQAAGRVGMPLLPPPLGGAMGAGGGSGEAKSGARKDEGESAERRLRRNGVQAELQGRAAREPRSFGVRQTRRRTARAGDDGRVHILHVPDKELPAADVPTPASDNG